MTKLTQKELKEWLKLIKAFKKGNKLDVYLKEELLDINYKVIEFCHHIHNENMMDRLKGY